MYISNKEKRSILLGQDPTLLLNPTIKMSLLKKNNSFSSIEIHALMDKDSVAIKSTFLNPNRIKREQLKRIRMLKEENLERVLQGRPYFSMKELSLASKVPETILKDIFKIEAYHYRDKTANRVRSLNPIYGEYIIPNTKESDFETLAESTDYTKVYERTMGIEFNVITLNSDFESEENAPHRLKAHLQGEVYPILGDAQGFKHIFIPNSIDIWFNKNTSIEKIVYIFKKFHFKVLHSQREIAYYHVTFESKRSDKDLFRTLFKVIDSLQKLDEVRFAEPVQVGFDDFEEEQVSVDLNERNKFWFYYDMEIDKIHQTYTKGSKEVEVFIIDRGCRMSHEDLKDKFRSDWRDLDLDFEYRDSPDSTSPNQIDTKHGTMVTGIVAKIAPECTLIPLKVGAWYGGRAVAISSALSYISEGKRAIINLSWKTDGEHIGIREALKEAQEANVVVVTSAGNNGRQMENEMHYPSGYVWLDPILDNICSVGATTASRTKASYSYFGEKSLSFSAPGGERGGEGTAIYSTSTTHDSSYAYSAGTSFSSPYVAGMIALLLSSNLNLTAKEVIERLKQTADKLPHSKLGAGLINGLEAFKIEHVFVEDKREDSATHYNKDSKLNLNLGTFEELIKIPHLGNYVSNEIIVYREQNGDFSDLWELMNLYIDISFILYLSNYLYCKK